ncbi:MAG: CobW family GTP-binding protein [Opitutales bacterium]
MARVPVNLITGYLGAGKTTVIRHLLAHRPDREKWAVVVNEFGKIGLDQALLGEESSGTGAVAIREIAGGCVCCAANLALEQTLVDILRREKPTRILIEPTGLGHPPGMLDALQGPWLKPHLEPRATVCVVDPRQAAQPRWQAEPVFRDQLELADVILLHKSDLVETTDRETVEGWIRETFYPPKVAILTGSQGALDPAWLDRPGTGGRTPQFPEIHAQGTTHPLAPLPSEKAAAEPEPGKPVRLTGSSGDVVTGGWLFHREDIFSAEATLALLDRWTPQAEGSSTKAESIILRLKGVFHFEGNWVVVNAVGSDKSAAPAAWRSDTRLEIIAKRPGPDWNAMEAELLACRMPQGEK